MTLHPSVYSLNLRKLPGRFSYGLGARLGPSPACATCTYTMPLNVGYHCCSHMIMFHSQKTILLSMKYRYRDSFGHIRPYLINPPPLCMTASDCLNKICLRWIEARTNKLDGRQVNHSLASFPGRNEANHSRKCILLLELVIVRKVQVNFHMKTLVIASNCVLDHFM